MTEPLTPVESRDDDRPPVRVSAGLIVWGMLSLGFLAYLGFGSVQARIWRLGHLYFEDRSVFHVWVFEGRNLPNVSKQTLLDGMFYCALAVLTAGTILGLWYLLDEVRNDESARSSSADAAPRKHV